MLGSSLELIAEVKTASPFGFKSNKLWDELFEIANQYGDMISVHTDPRWDGSFELIARARRMTTKPILAKGIHKSDDEIKRALGNGADKVLVVGRIPPDEYLSQCLLEPQSLAQLSEYPEGAQAVWNSRDLKTGGLKTETFEQARALWPGWLCQASNIRTIHDVQSTADAVLVGQHLLEFVKSLGENST